jgi:hypothetical protein
MNKRLTKLARQLGVASPYARQYGLVRRRGGWLLTGTAYGSTLVVGTEKLKGRPVPKTAEEALQAAERWLRAVGGACEVQP